MSIINCFSANTGLKIDAIVQSYYAYAGENISAGDFVEFVNGLPNEQSIASFESLNPHCLSATLMGTNKFLIVYGVVDGNYNSYCKGCAKVGTISGSTITFGSEYVFMAAGNASGIGNCVAVDKIDTDKCIIAYTSSTDRIMYTVIGTISDTTISFGSATTIEDNVGVSNYDFLNPTIICIDTTKAVLVYNKGSNGVNASIAILTISGTTITSTRSNFSATGGYNIWQNISICKMTSTYFLVVGCNSVSSYSAGCVITISGTSITYGTLYTFFEGTTYGQKTCMLTSTKGFIMFIDNNDNYTGKALVCVRSVAVLSFYNVYTFYDANKGIYDNNSLCLLPVSSNKVIMTYTITNRSARNPNKINMKVATISTTNEITFSDTLEMGSASSSVGTLYPRLVKIDTSNFLLAYSRYSATAGIACTYNYSGISQTQVRKTTTSQFNGIAKTKGIGGDQIKVYIPDI